VFGGAALPSAGLRWNDDLEFDDVIGSSSIGRIAGFVRLETNSNPLTRRASRVLQATDPLGRDASNEIPDDIRPVYLHPILVLDDPKRLRRANPNVGCRDLIPDDPLTTDAGVSGSRSNDTSRNSGSANLLTGGTATAQRLYLPTPISPPSGSRTGTHARKR